MFIEPHTLARAHVLDVQMLIVPVSALRVIASAETPFPVQFAHALERLVRVAARLEI
jgi:hypothetical protein